MAKHLYFISSTQFEVALTGRLKRGLSANATMSVFVTLNGTDFNSVNCTICTCPLGELNVNQHGKLSCPPEAGDVFISAVFWHGIPTYALKTGYYGVRTLMEDADDSKIAEFEGELWIETACEGDREPPCCPVM